MRRVLLFLTGILLFTVLQAQVYQLPNSGFETWDGTGSDDEPTQWNGFPSADCSLIIGCSSATQTRHQKSTDTRPGSSGTYSLKIFATEITILGNTIVANGNITTGQIKIGSTTPSSNQNYNITRTTDAAFRQPLNAKPDSISFWAKFMCPSSTQLARISAIIHDSYDYRDPDSGDANAPSHVVGKAIHNFPRDNQSWKKYTIPFDYNFPSPNPAYVLITFTTNMIAGEGSASDNLYIDDISFIYNPKLSDLKVNGITVPGFHPDITNYSMSVSCFSAQNIQATSASPNAGFQITQADFNNPQGQVLVSHGDASRTYTINFHWEHVSEIYAEICQGAGYNDSWFQLPAQNTPGIFIFDTTFSDTPGCDSLIRLQLTVHPNYHPDTITAQICDNGTYNFFGTLLTEAGIYDTIIQTQYGCDSVVVLHLSVGSFYQNNINAKICQGETYSENGFNLSVSGTDTLFYQAVDGCDSLIVLHLTVNPSYTVTINDTILIGYSYNLHGFSITEQYSEGTFSFSQYMITSEGCDSTIHLNLTVTDSDEHITDDPDFSVNVFPNPSIDELTIDLITISGADFLYELFDPYGQIINAGIISDKTATISMIGLAKGLYILRITSPGGISRALKILKH
jgi:hypothetical protein